MTDVIVPDIEAVDVVVPAPWVIDVVDNIGMPGPPGPQGPTGATGSTGPQGTSGVGVPTGGTAGQVLAKIDATNYNTQWVPPAAGGGSGTVTSVAAGTGLTASPSPIVGAGTMSLTVPVTVANGGTGLNSLTQYAVMVGNGAAGISFQPPSVNGAILASNGAALMPTFRSLQSLMDVAAGTPVQGQLWYRSGVAWQVLGAGTAGQFLQTNGTTGNPAWAAAAPLTSPVFTGDPQAPTPATADNDTSIATTAFVKAQAYVTGGPYLPTAGGVLTGDLSLTGSGVIAGNNRGFYGRETGGTPYQLVSMGSDNGIYFGDPNLQHGMTFRGTTVYAVFSSAATYNQSGAWSVISDSNMKENVTPYERGLEAILALNPVAFTYATTSPFGDDGGTPRFGIMAQEAELVVPEIVGETSTKTHGTVKTTEPSNLVFALINAVKTLTERLTVAEAAIAALSLSGDD